MGRQLVVGHDREFDLSTLPTLVAEENGAVTGTLQYQVDDEALEVVSIYAARQGNGVGTALLAAAGEVARKRGLHRMWLVTTNDNLDALRFYQRRGMRITKVDPGAVDRSRKRKPAIPEIGYFGIPLHDELTLEADL